MIKTLCVVFLCFTVEIHAKTIMHDRYIVFDSHAEFEAYVSGSNPKLTLLPYSDPRYVRAETILQRVWAGYQQLFPSHTFDLPVPQIAIQDHQYLDASVNGDLSDPKLAPHAFYMGQRLLELSDDGVAGVMAHELTHLLFPDFQFKYYRAALDHEPLGFLQTNDPDVEKAYTELQSITRVVGPMRIPELNGLPAPIVYDGKLYDLIVKLAGALGDPNQPACQKVQVPFPKWRLDLVLKYLSKIDQTLHMTPEQKQDLDRDTKDYIADLRSCLGHKDVPFLEALQSILHQPITELEAKYEDYAAVFDREENIVDGVFAVTEYGYGKLEEFQRQHTLDRFRVYSNEEYCDDNSVRVVRAIGYRPQAIEEFFLHAMEDAQPGTRARCLAVIEAGKVPPYGLLTDTHHAGCYRVYHARAFTNHQTDGAGSGGGDAGERAFSIESAPYRYRR
ncbi:MAG: hypothetical protein AB7G93_01900 [Bdellovibrionales bacterium]